MPPTDLIYGPVRPQRSLPKQQADLVLLLAERYNRSAAALHRWSETAKKCVEYFEGEQWKKEDLMKLTRQGRPALKINKIKPLVNLVLGYHMTNLTDIRYLPGHDGSGTSEIAAAATAVAKQISEINQLPYVDAEVFLDGVLTGRGYYDCRLDFQENDLGEVRWESVDPFSTYLDPDGDKYDINSGSYVFTSRWVSLDEIEYYYGEEAMTAVSPWITGGTFTGYPMTLYDANEELTPWRRFGGEENTEEQQWSTFFNGFWDWIDKSRKSIRMIDVQHYMNVVRPFFVDLETGDRVPVPDFWDRNKVRKVLYFAERNGDPLTIERRRARRLRHTQMVGDVIVYDQWSRYRSFTLIPFFPYFRRGKTKGMVEDLLDPQDEINKRRSARINIIGRTANSGWKVEKGTLNAQQRQNLEDKSGTPGFILFWDSKGGTLPEPKEITPSTPPIAQKQLELDSETDIKAIAGVNDSFLGQLDAANASGRAVEARQRQAVVGLEGFMGNYRRSKELGGRKQLEIIQDHYTEQRVIRTTGGDRVSSPQRVIINQRTAAGVVNNVTIGKYAVAVDESPLSATFLAAQFDEIMRLKELNVPIPDEWVIDASSLGRKEELKQALAAARAALPPPMPTEGGTAPSGSAGDNVGAAGTEPGAPPPPQAMAAE